MRVLLYKMMGYVSMQDVMRAANCPLGTYQYYLRAGVVPRPAHKAGGVKTYYTKAEAEEIIAKLKAWRGQESAK